MTDTPHSSSPTMRRRNLAALLLAASTVALGACSDSPVAPRETAPALGASARALPTPAALAASLTFGAGATITATSTVAGVTHQTVIIDPSANVAFSADDHMVTIPAGAICDPLTSSYGPGTWDAACSAATQPITFEVTSWTDASGQSRVEFLPDVRFSPTKLVGLYLKSVTGATSTSASINWCRVGMTGCENEALSDASLATQRDPASGYVYRRVKHFSGYMVSVGLTDEPGDSTQSDAPTYP